MKKSFNSTVLTQEEINKLQAEKDLIGEFSLDSKDLDFGYEVPESKPADVLVAHTAQPVQIIQEESFIEVTTATTSQRTEFGLDVVLERSGSYAPADVGNAERFYDAYGNNFLYLADQGMWLFFDGKKWSQCTNNEHETYMLKVINNIKNEVDQAKMIAQGSEDGSAARFALKNIAAHYSSSCTAAKHKAAIKISETMVNFKARTADLDKDPYVFNFQNGSLNLKTNELSKFNRRDYLTQISNTTLADKADCPTWLKFLDDVFLGDTELVSYIQKVMGSALIGEPTKDQLFFMFYGSKGSNGKSTFLNIFENVMGEYGCTTSPLVWMQSDKPQDAESANPQVARLRGKRMVTANEGPEGKSFNEDLIKSTTGGDTITARHLFGNTFEFKSVLKLFFATNYKPNIKSSNTALWRRLRLIPFLAHFDEANKDTSLLDKLKTELPAIARWVVEGCMRYQQEGLKDTPKSVTESMDEYKTEMDRVGAFLGEVTTQEEGSNIPCSKIYELYTEYMKENGYKHFLNKLNFKRELERKGYIVLKTKACEVYKDLQLTSEVMF